MLFSRAYQVYLVQ